jgi:hypothetical protein
MTDQSVKSEKLELARAKTELAATMAGRIQGPAPLKSNYSKQVQWPPPPEWLELVADRVKMTGSTVVTNCQRD